MTMQFDPIGKGIDFHNEEEEELYISAKNGIEALLKLCYNDDPPQDIMLETPLRFITALAEMTQGMREMREIWMRDHITTFHDPHYDQMVVVSNIHFTSLCEHHLLPFEGKAHVGYLPSVNSLFPNDGYRIIGLSKIPRIVQFAASRLNMQERMCNIIIDILTRAIHPIGCGVIIEATHSCMTCRGARAGGSVARMQQLEGAFKDNAAVKEEFLQVALSR